MTRRRTRLNPDVRRELILEGAIEYFAECGFAGQMRDLAERLGVSEPLLYRYHGTKDALIEAVYDRVMDARWDPEWDVALRDRRVPITERLIDFYRSYLHAIDDGVWVRIVMHSSLDGLELTKRYVERHLSEVMATIGDELAVALEIDGGVRPEVVWHLHSTFIYYLIRKDIHQYPVDEDKESVVAEAVRVFVDGLRNRNGTLRVSPPNSVR